MSVWTWLSGGPHLLSQTLDFVPDLGELRQGGCSGLRVSLGYPVRLFLKPNLELSVVPQAQNPMHQRRRQEDCRKFEASIGYKNKTWSQRNILMSNCVLRPALGFSVGWWVGLLLAYLSQSTAGQPSSLQTHYSPGSSSLSLSGSSVTGMSH